MQTIIGTFIVQFLMNDNYYTYLTFDHEGDEKFATFGDYLDATEFGSYDEALEAISTAKWEGMKFLKAKIL